MLYARLSFCILLDNLCYFELYHFNYPCYLGCKAVDIRIKTRIISFWMNIVNGKQTKLSKWLYLLLLGEYDGGIHQHKWIHFIKHILISVGRPDLLNKEVIENPKSIKNQISKTL